MEKKWTAYVMQTDKNYLKSKKNTYLNETVIKKAIYVGITSKTVEERFLAHNGKIEGLRGLKKKYGKPVMILEEFTKEGPNFHSTLLVALVPASVSGHWLHF